MLDKHFNIKEMLFQNESGESNFRINACKQLAARYQHLPPSTNKPLHCLGNVLLVGITS